MRLTRVKTSRLILIFASLLMGSQLVIFLLTIISFGRIGTIAKRSSHILVQLRDGSSVIATPLNNYERSDESLKYTVNTKMTGLLSWQRLVYNSESNARPQIDEGVQTPKGKITTSAFEASLAVSQDFSAELAAYIAELTPDNFFNPKSKAQSLLIIEHLSDPQKIGKGRWRLDMIARLVIYQGQNSTGRPAIPFNKTVFVRAIEPPILPKKPTKLQKQLYEARKSGIEIYFIKDLKL